MRELNECTAEVFRRSEKRIKERRRNRNRVIALCIPLCMIITVWSVMFLPAIFPANNKNASDGEGMSIMNSIYDSNGTYIQVEIKSTGNTIQSDILKNDADEVAQIYYTIQSAFVTADDGDGENTKKPDESENKDFMQSESSASSGYNSSGYEVIFTAENGVNTVFFITRDKLINESTNRKVALTEVRYSEILTALGLTVTWEEEP